MDNFNELFDSDSEDDFKQNETTQQEQYTEQQVDQGDIETGQYEKQQQQYQEQQRKALLEELEGSEDANEFQEDIDQDLDQDREQQVEETVAHYDIPELDEKLQDMKAKSQLYFVQSSNLVGLDHTPFDPETFEVQTYKYYDEQGRERILVRDKNVIRWRYQRSDDGTYVPETNARIVEWSDGSRQLLIGDQAFNVQEQDMQHQNNFLFKRAGPVIQLVFTPTSVRPSFMGKSRIQQTVKSQIGDVVTIRDPEKENIKLEQEYLKQQREKEMLAKKRQRTMQQTSQKFHSQQQTQKLSAAFLEQEDEEDYEVGRHVDYEKEAQREQRILNAQQQQKQQKQQQDQLQSQAFESEEEDRQAKKQKTRRGMLLDDDDDDDDDF